jgi:lipoprotein-anchoring transpeptidase ErfK/SrfK
VVAGGLQLALAAGAGALAAGPALPKPGAAPGAAAPAGPTSLLAVEQRLAALHYDVGAVDGVADDNTSNAILAFQKVIGMDRTGTLDPHVASIVMSVQSPPPPLVPGGGANRVEVDLVRQVLFLYEGDALSKILPVSSGTPDTPTPTGAFHVYRQATGWETSPLGRLYNSQYFTGGYAIHGSPSVPAQPASHGCIRIPMSAAEWFPGHVSVGTPVFVLGG